MPRVNISFGMISSSPQLKPKYADELAFRHIQGIFSLIASSNPLEAEGTKLLTRKHFSTFDIYEESDWGNPQLQEIISRTNSWRCFADIITANGYFKATMKRHSEKHLGWFWALEWNKSYRVIGTIGETNILNNLPELDLIRASSDGRRRGKEIPLDPMQDTLFSPIVTD